MIRVLEKEVADKIAAGEVVDRPLSVVKELVENALDAGADTVVIEIKNGGKTYIRVTDNGCGIPQQEAALAFLRHATSKIISDKDLDQIRTLGFRGEALASIAAVSRTQLLTKTREEKVGTKLHIDGGRITEHVPTGCPEGTTLIVADLFYNTPARLKFMKSDGAESRLIIDFVSQIGLAYPAHKIRLISNGNVLFSTPGKGDRYQSILTVYSRETGSQLVPVLCKEGGLLLEGYVSSPADSRATKRSQIFFVNGRIISSKIMERGVAAAYADRLFEGRHPIAFLFLKIRPDQLDVNIHPNKREVRFHDEKLVTDFTAAAIRKALATKEAVPEMRNDDLFKLSRPPQKSAGLSPEIEKPVSGSTAEQEQVDIKKILYQCRQKTEQEEQPVLQDLRTELYNTRASRPAAVPKPFEFTSLEITGAIFGTYITAVDADCFYLIDQHAAHERIFFERLMRQYQAAEKLKQTILVPFVINTSFAVSESQYDWMDSLSDFGYEIEEFGPKAYLVKAIPAFMELSAATEFIDYFLDNISENTNLENRAKIETIATSACKSAVKAHDYLSNEEVIRLVSDLGKCDNPYSCPHGRPTFIKMSKYEIEKLFKRV